MELSFKELKKREVVNVADGSSFGHITDLTLSFPSGKLNSITVPGAKTGVIPFLFNRNKLVIEENNIIKIGGDVILVNIKCGETCASNINLNPVPPPRPQGYGNNPPSCHHSNNQPCPPSSSCSPYPNGCNSQDGGGFDSGRIDLSDY